MARVSDGSRRAPASFAPVVGRLFVAASVFLVGIYVVYGFGAGYFGYFTLPSPINFVVAAALLLGLILVLWKVVARRL